MTRGTKLKPIRLLLALLFITVFNAEAQEFSVEALTFLPEIAKESSGLIFLNDKLITHNDSGNEAKLYEFDPVSGQLTGEVGIEQVRNTDWEDLAIDQEFIYIADIGNNDGDRQDLKIYRVLLSEYLLGTSTVTADSILFSYQDQTSFVSTPLSNFDAAALISYGDSLYIFTKNWADQHSNIYSLPKTPGNFEATRIGRIDSEGLVTGAVYNPFTEEIMLIGYSFQSAFLIRLGNFEEGIFDQGEITRYPFSIQGSFQFEAIAIVDETDYFITSESNDQGDARLWRVNTESVVGLEDSPYEKSWVYPNPAGGQLFFKGLPEPVVAVDIYNTLGAKVRSMAPTSPQSSQGFSLSLLGVPKGLYQIKISTPSREILQRIIVDH